MVLPFDYYRRGTSTDTTANTAAPEWDTNGGWERADCSTSATVDIDFAAGIIWVRPTPAVAEVAELLDDLDDLPEPPSTPDPIPRGPPADDCRPAPPVSVPRWRDGRRWEVERARPPPVDSRPVGRVADVGLGEGQRRVTIRCPSRGGCETNG